MFALGLIGTIFGIMFFSVFLTAFLGYMSMKNKIHKYNSYMWFSFVLMLIMLFYSIISGIFLKQNFKLENNTNIEKGE